MSPSPALDFSALFDGLTDEAVILDGDGRVVSANAAWKSFCRENGGNSESYFVGSNYFDVCGRAEGQSSAEAAVVPEGLRRVMIEGGTFRCEYPCDSPTEKRWFEMSAGRIDTPDAPFLLIQHRNITRRHVERIEAAQAHLQAEQLAAIVAHSRDAILSYDLTGRIISWNRGAEALYGYRAEDAMGKSLEILYPPNWPVRIEEYRDKIISGEITSFEAERIARDGSQRTVWISCAAVRGIDGAIHSIANIHRDVTEVRRAEAERDIIAGEVVHRAKNMLSVVNAILRQTSRNATTLEEFQTKFSDRIQSLAATTDLLVSGNWSSVQMQALVESQLHPFVPEGSEVVTVEGPGVRLAPQAVQVIGMALHELCTNSAKYGALRYGNGKVRLAWDVTYTLEGVHLDVSWIETGISSTVTPDRKGFGNTVLTILPVSMLEAEVNFDLRPDCAEWRIRVPSAFFKPGLSDA